MTPRDQLHHLVDAAVDDDTTQVHGNVDIRDEDNLPDELERKETLRLLFQEQAEAYPAQRHDRGR